VVDTLNQFGKAVRRELEIEPPKVYVKEYVTTEYICRNCEANGEGAKAFFKKEGAPTKPLFYNSPVAPSTVLNGTLSLRLKSFYFREQKPILCKLNLKN
jgi:hypothetical protein